MRKFTKKQYLAAGAAAVIIAGGAGAAFAYWTTSGSGSGSASTGTSTTWDVATDAATGDPLTPGGPTDTVAFHIKNNNSGVQHLQTVTVTVANPDGTSWTSGSCSKDDFTVGVPSFTAGDVAAGATADGSVTIQMVNNTTGNQDDCKNVTVPLYIVAG